MRTPPTDFATFIHQGVAEGVMGGIVGFMVKNNVKLAPGPGVRGNPLNTFTSKLLAEYMKNPKGYPFEESLKGLVVARTADEMENIKKLWEANDMKVLSGLLHLIGGSAVADFLEKNREKALSIIRDIRRVD